MAKGKKEGTSQTAKPKPSLLKSPVIPLVIAGVIGTIAVLSQAGFITLPHLGGDLVYEIHPAAIIGVRCAYEFSELIPLLDPEGSNRPYTFYLGSGVGFPPMGLILGVDGVLKGTPTGKGGTFQVCVKDVSGKSVCRTYHLAVNPKSAETSTTAPSGGCVINPRCGEMAGSARIEGTFVSASCDCPTGTYLYQTLDDGTKYCACR